jgi:hypothetical protein
LSIPEYFQPSINKLQFPAGAAPKDVKRMVDAAVTKAREEAMADLQIQLQMATKQAGKDIKKLRKNVHDLNAELEAAEQEGGRA